MKGSSRKRNFPGGRPRLSSGKSPAILLGLLGWVLAACSVQSDYQKARDLDTPEAYHAFLDRHPDDQEYSPLAKKDLERLAFGEARKQNTYEGYLRFLKRYPYGEQAALAHRAAEDMRASELGIRLYRQQPADFYEWVSSRNLPYRILVRSSSPDAAGSRHVEGKWYSELVRRGLFVPMDPQKTYRVSQDLTLYLRESVVVLCVRALALVEAEVQVGGKAVQTYLIAADHIEQYLLYEIFKDREFYDRLMAPPEEEVRRVGERFERRRDELPLEGPLALEFEIAQQAREEDQQFVREFVAFLADQPLCEGFYAYPRGRPPKPATSRRLHLSVDPETHAPEISSQWRSAGPSVDWSRWNTRWILRDRQYFFQKMTMDLMDLLRSQEVPNR
jgi:hypothetical protein